MMSTGPAHALYFLTYEAVKHAMGGNNSGHHPLAGGITHKPWKNGNRLTRSSCQWGLCNHCQRRFDEPIRR